MCEPSRHLGGTGTIGLNRRLRGQGADDGKGRAPVDGRMGIITKVFAECRQFEVGGHIVGVEVDRLVQPSHGPFEVALELRQLGQQEMGIRGERGRLQCFLTGPFGGPVFTQVGKPTRLGQEIRRAGLRLNAPGGGAPGLRVLG